MKKIISVCGLLCNECNYFGYKCQGCYSVQGETFWSKEVMPDKICPLYKCSRKESMYNNCGQCEELPCEKFVELKDPDISDEQHKKSINERVARLINI